MRELSFSAARTLNHRRKAYAADPAADKNIWGAILRIDLLIHKKRGILSNSISRDLQRYLTKTVSKYRHGCAKNFRNKNGRQSFV